MSRTIEEILDLAINELASGKPVGLVLAEFSELAPEHAAELAEILPVISPALNLPKNEVPAPAKRRRYLAALHISWQERLQKIFRVAMVPAGAVFAFALTVQLVNAAQASLPGETLYRFKLAAERTRVAMATDPSEKAHLELGYSQKRLAEVQTVLQSKDSSPDQQAAALNELQQQTQKTAALVPSVAAADVLANKDNTLFKSLIAVNNQQKDLLKSFPAQDVTKDIAGNVLQATEDQQKTIATLLAAVNDQTLIDLVEIEVSVSGAVKSVDATNKTIVVEDSSFVLNDHTKIIYNGQNLDLAQLLTKSKVKVSGSKEGNTLTAEKIEVVVLATAPAKPGEVKGAATGTTKPPVVDPTPAPAPEPTPETPAPDPDPNTVTGGYIIEQPE